MTDLHSMSDTAESHESLSFPLRLSPLSTVAAYEGLQLSCSTDACHITRSEFELISTGETRVLSYGIEPDKEPVETK